MDYQTKKENLLVLLKNMLNKDDVKLWLPPYNVDGNCNFDSLQELTMKYHRSLNIDQDACFELLQDLQNTSLCRLEEKRNFQTHGLASLRVRISGKQIPEFTVQITLCDLANDLRAMVAEKVEVPVQRLKLICGGRVLVAEQILGAQNVKHGCTILVVILPSEEEKHVLTETNNNQMVLNEMRSDVECLLNGKKKNAYLNVTNQLGASLNLPPAEEKALAVAMALHEKGKKAFCKGEFPSALVFFLEADTEFKYCRSDILQKVDNYALLNLDIVWTYLHLQSLHCLNDAEERLKLCEQGFLRTYGANMERLHTIKGTSGNESVLLVRLRLLQGVLFYLTNRPKEAAEKFSEVEANIQLLKVDSENVKTLCNLGYSASEARIALRATFNDLNAAVEHIYNQREEKRRIAEHERIRKFADRYKCQNGELVNLTVLEQLYNLNFTRLFGVFALRNSNNCINEALMWIENFFSSLYTHYPHSAVDRLKKLEFDESDVRQVLRRHHYQLSDTCVPELLRLVDEECPMQETSNTSSNSVPADASAGEPSTPNSAPASSESTATSSKSTPPKDPNQPGSSSAAVREENERKRKEREYEAYNRLQGCISDDADGYLDIDLKSEEDFLHRYKSLLPQ